MSAQDKLDRSAAKHGLGSDERKRKIQKAKDFFSKPVPTYSKDELRKMGHPVEGRFDIVIPEPRGSNKNSDKQRAAKAARRLANREKNKKHMAKIDQAIQKDAAHSATGKLTKSNDPIRKRYQSGASGRYFSKYEAYRKPTQAEIDADKRKDGKSKDSSTRYRDVKKKMYGNAMGGLKRETAGQEFTAVPVNTAGDVSGGDRMSIAKLDAIMKKRSKDMRQKEDWKAEMRESLDEASATNVNKIRSAYRDFMKKKGKNFEDVAMSLTMISNRMTSDSPKAEKIVKTEASRIQGIVSATFKTEEGKEIRDLLKKHGLYSPTGSANAAILKLTYESVELDENKVFFVKVGDGRDSMTVKTNAKNSREALKKMRAEHPKDKVSLDINQKQGKSAGTFESSLPAHLQGIIGKDGNIDAKKVKKDPVLNKNKTKVTDVTPTGYGPKEATMADRAVLKAVRIAKDMAGNHTGASKRIEKMKKGLSDHPKVKSALRLANESVSTADKKPQNYRDPETGKLKTRMVPVDKDVVRGNDVAKVVKRKKFKDVR